jgi:Tol biopolymer transport system component
VRQLFHDALGRPSSARDAFVAGADQYNTETRQEVRSLLAAHRQAIPFLQSGAVGISDDLLIPSATLRVGDQVGRFEVTAALGAGGMGEVYRARDLQLARDVALKILPPAMAADPARLARFERESRVLAAIDHPNIAAIHSVEHVDGLHLLVLQFVDGSTLADLMKQRRLALAESLEIASQLARALEAAHEGGIVHRDLKPANVKVANDGHVSLLDFGLAKEQSAPADGQNATVEGVILGTWGYMSPEQARGLPADKRTDIWAFGCILYELLSARPAFASDLPSDSIAAVLEREPDWSALPDEVSPRIRLLLRRLLEKDRANRLHDIADARLEIDDAREGSAPLEIGTTLRRWHRLSIAAAVPVLAATVLTTGWWTREPAGPADLPLTQFRWTLPSGMLLQSAPAVSPDGRRLAFAASTSGGPPELYVRHFENFEVRAITGSQYAQQPFWSPDGKSLAFFARGALMRVALDGGVPVTITRVHGEPKGGAWGRDGTIVYSPAQIESGLWKVRSTGGTPAPATVLATADGDNAHRWPVFLPDGVHFLFYVRSNIAERRGVYLGRIDRAAAPATMLFRSESEAVFEQLTDREGVLLNVTDGNVEVRRLHLSRLTTSDPKRLAVSAGGNTPHNAAMLSAGAGLLAHVDGALPYGARLASVQLSGEDHRIASTRAIVNWPRLSYDGSRLATAMLDPLTGTADVWVTDLERGTRTRATHEPIAARLPVWSRDGSRLAYVSGFNTPALVVAAADGTGDMTAIPCPWKQCEPTDWSGDGRWIVVQVPAEGQSDVWLLSADGNGEARPLLTAPYTERDARVSRDARLLAYVSEESGRPEVSVRNIEGTPRRVVVSPGGGSQPVWLRDGRSLAFVDPDGLLQLVSVVRETGGGVRTTTPIRPAVPPIGAGHWFTQYDVSPDGRVHFIDREPGPTPDVIGFVLGWHDLLD